MNYKFAISTSLILIFHLINSIAVRIQHPSLWLRSRGTLLLTTNHDHKDKWRYIASAHKTKAYKECLIIQNIDGSTLRFSEKDNSFSLTNNITSNSVDQNIQLFILTLNLQAVKLNHQDDRKIVQTIRQYITEDTPNGKNFILIRAVYWPYYLCSDSKSMVYGSKIKHNRLSHDCIWYRVLSPSGYMRLIKLDQMPFYNVTYQRNKALSSYPRGHLRLSPYSHHLNKSFYWAVALSQQSIPRHRYHRSVVLQFNNQISPKLKWIFDNNKDLNKSIISLQCLNLDKIIQKEINFFNIVFQRLSKMRDLLSNKSADLPEIFDRFITFLPPFYEYRIKLESYARNARFYARHNLHSYRERNEVRLKKLKLRLSPILSSFNQARYQLCQSLANTTLCACLTLKNDTGTLCSHFNFSRHMTRASTIWSLIPTDEDVLLAATYRIRYKGATSIIERRRSYLRSKPRSYSVRKLDRACL